MKKSIVKFENVDFSFSEKKVLSCLSLEVCENETFVIVGGNESGKSTILKLCAGVLRADHGSVQVMGKDLKVLNKKKLLTLRLKIGYLFQHGSLLNNLSIFDNIALPLRYHTKLKEPEIAERVFEQLKMFNLDDDSSMFPAHFSERKKTLFELARAVILKPKLLIFDEPVGTLDPDGFRALVRFAHSLKKNLSATMLISVRSAAGATALADRVGVLRDGRLTFNGPIEEFTASKDNFLESTYY